MTRRSVVGEVKRKLKIGIISEGDSEVVSLSLIYPQLCARAGVQLIKPLLADVDPKSEAPVIARRVVERIRLAVARGASIVIVILDREDLQESAAQRADILQKAISKIAPCEVRVVIKDRKFENWLIAAPSALEAQPGRFSDIAKLRNAAVPNKADNVADAEELLKCVVARRGYDKRQDAIKILQKAQVAEMAANSRSFRRLLAVLGDPAYQEGSKRP